ncbi:MAG TPA: PQQ-binding-like beta-propeller repeat protein [Pirellulales bacterium]|jgi:outer membrane protein assembly factor BamB|nr:PQQ-binding-like beta-propeller repeat protein [Pirellulales bacterium]
MMLRSMRPVAVAMVTIGFTWSLAAALSAQDWTRFRGPNGQGQSDAKTVPDHWTDQDYNWKVKLSGVGHSSPVFWGDRIFLTSATAAGELQIQCLQTTDGQQVWEKSYQQGTFHIHTQNSFASSTPAVDKDHLYVAWATPQEYTLVALSHAGKELWRRNLGPFESQHGFGTSPIVFDNMVIITNDQDGPKSFLIAVDCRTGKNVWQNPREHAKGNQNCSYSTPSIYQPEGGAPQLIVNSWAHGISSLDPKTGKLNWEDRVFPLRPIGCPVIAGGLIWGNCGEGGGKNSVFAVRPGDKNGKPPEVVYKFDKSTAPYVTSLVAYKNWIFFWGDKGIVSCIDMETGKVLYTERACGTCSGSPIRVNDRLYCITADGDVVVLAASDKFEKISTESLGELSRSTPAVSNGVLYLRTESQLFSLGGKRK